MQIYTPAAWRKCVITMTGITGSQAPVTFLLWRNAFKTNCRKMFQSLFSPKQNELLGPHNATLCKQL